MLMQSDLIDGYRLLVHPVVVGKGKRLFCEGSQRKALGPREAGALSTGVVALTHPSAETRSE
jgi:dihydrofolate reductase